MWEESGSGFDCLGAADSFANQYFTIRIKNIDYDKLKSAISGSTGSIASGALSLLDASPKAVFDLLAPIVKNVAVGYGVDTEITVSNKPVGKKRAFSEFWPGLIGGLVIGGSALVIVKGIQALLVRR